MAEPVDLAPDEKLCPYCAETIKRAAIRCRYCHSDLPDAPVAETVDDVEPPPPPPPPPLVVDDEPPAAEPLVDEEPRGPAFLASLRLMIGLLVLCLVLLAVSAFAWWRSDHPGGASSQQVITSASARDAGMQAAATLTQKVLSYSWKSLDQDVTSAESLLAPSFRSEYAKTMAGVHAQTIKNQVVLKATVVATSVVSATPQKVVALVFVNQVTTAKGTNNQRLDQNRVLVTLTRDGGEWRVSKMDAF